VRSSSDDVQAPAHFAVVVHGPLVWAPVAAVMDVDAQSLAECYPGFYVADCVLYGVGDDLVE
jgi:hypothetical protein